jgi:zona occludens toxin (predicted ATPase)
MDSIDFSTNMSIVKYPFQDTFMNILREDYFDFKDYVCEKQDRNISGSQTFQLAVNGFQQKAVRFQIFKLQVRGFAFKFLCCAAV